MVVVGSYVARSALYAEVKLHEAAQMSVEMESPNKFVSAFACAMLQHMLPAFEAHRDAAAGLFQELFR